MAIQVHKKKQATNPTAGPVVTPAPDARDKSFGRENYGSNAFSGASSLTPGQTVEVHWRPICEAAMTVWIACRPLARLGTILKATSRVRRRATSATVATAICNRFPQPSA